MTCESYTKVQCLMLVHQSRCNVRFFFDLMLFLCRRGQENLRHFKKTDFSVKIAANGRQFIEKSVDELTKNRRESNDAQQGGVVYETGTPTCPVASFKLYISHLNPKIEEFFQRPKSAAPLVGPWFDAQVLGVNYLSQMMKNISIDAELSEVYTNHCIRATSVTVLDDCGVEARHIMAVSGHRSEGSIRSYAARTGIGMKRKMSESLSTFCENKSNKLDMGVNLDENDDNDIAVCSIEAPCQSSCSSKSFNQMQCELSSNLSSFIGQSAHYAEFSGCTFNFNPPNLDKQ